jgi:RNA polymerase sigma factor (sigma-70 family)
MGSPTELVEHYFRHEYGRLVALLTRQLGVRHLELAEDVVQSALSRALTAWARSGVPAEPSAWLYRTSRNLAIDALRRQESSDRILRANVEPSSDSQKLVSEVACFDSEIGDETLRLLYLCCHPAITPESRVTLALKTVGGFGVQEIASGLLTTASSVEKRLTRAKEKLREIDEELVEMDSSQLTSRTESVLSTVYLIFNEGFSASTGDSPIREDLCEEAIRMAHMLSTHPICGCPAAYALLALLLFHSARFDSRLDESGRAVLLADQDRSQWNWERIRQAMHWMEKAAQGSDLSRYHVETAIAWEHCRAAEFSATDWDRIAQLYEKLLERSSTPMIRLNAAVACSYADGPEAGRLQLLSIDGVDRQRLHPWWDCCMAQLQERSGNAAIAVSHWRDALALAKTSAQKQFIQSQLRRLD